MHRETLPSARLSDVRGNGRAWLSAARLLTGPETKKDIRKCAHRTQSGIPCHMTHIAVTNGETDYCGFSEGVPYPFPPQNKYQEWMRSGNLEPVASTVHSSLSFPSLTLCSQYSTRRSSHPGRQTLLEPYSLDPQLCSLSTR